MPPVSRVADILMEQGRQAAEARRVQGQIWAGAAQRLGELPGEFVQQQQQQKRQALQEQAAKQNLAIGGEELQQFARKRQGQELAKSLYAANTTIGDDGHLKYNDEAIVNGFRTAGFDELADHHLDFGAKLEDHIAQTQVHKAAYDASVQKTYADAYGSLLAVPEEKRAEAYPVWREALRAKGKSDPVFAALPESYPGYEAFQAQYESHRTNAERLADAKEKAAAAKEARITVKPDETVYDTGQLDAAGKPKPLVAGVPKLDTEAELAKDAATLGTPSETPTAKTSQAALLSLQAPTREREASAAAARTTEQGIQRGHLAVAQQREAREAAAGDTSSTKAQQKFEQQYRTVLTRAMSSRSGGIGAEDAKVQQANHLLSLLHQTYNAKTGTYNIPKVLQGELAAGLARLVAPGGNVGIEMMREFNQRTAKGDFAGALTYITGQPVASTTQGIATMLKDSIERQGKVAEENREGEMRYLRGLAPTELEEGRRQQLEKTSLNPLRLSRVIQNQKTGERKLQISTDGGETWK